MVKQRPTETAWVTWSRSGSGAGLVVLVTIVSRIHLMVSRIHLSRVRVETMQDPVVVGPLLSSPEGSEGRQSRAMAGCVSSLGWSRRPLPSGPPSATVPSHHGPRLAAHPRQALVWHPAECRARQTMGQVRKRPYVRRLRPGPRAEGRRVQCRAAERPEVQLPSQLCQPVASLADGPARVAPACAGAIPEGAATRGRPSPSGEGWVCRQPPGTLYLARSA